MQSPQEIFARVSENRDKLHHLKSELNEHFMSNTTYAEQYERRKEIGKQMAAIRKEIGLQVPDLIVKIEDMKIDLKSDMELLNDILLTKLTKGEDVKIENKNGQMLLPIFSVKLVRDAI